MSGPLLDRIDIHLDVPAVKYQELLLPKPAETSLQIKERTTAAREKQLIRFKSTAIYTNAQMGQKHLRTFCQITDSSKDLLKSAISGLGLSARAHDKILKVARTISDLEGTEEILPHHIAEAIQYRSLDRNWLG